jgi:hypothetical protein
MSAPVFAVVGRPNKGKSSIVATLARDDSVYIDARSGSTRESHDYPMQVNGETLYTLVDTPGIQRARGVLDWLQERCPDAASRPQTVRDFVAAHRDGEDYRDECELLAPIIDGAGIIYVVDGSVPFGADYEAEMEILRWCGRPSLALINPIDGDAFADEWHNGLGQFFRTVRLFDAQRAEFPKQLELLELFGHLDHNWREPLERAVRILREERANNHRGAAILIAEMIADALNYQARQKLLPGMPEDATREALFLRYQSHLAERERRCRQQVEETYYYQHLERSEEELALADSDLFAVDNWYLWGLNRRSLAIAASSAGALLGGATGAAVDTAAGGALLGTVTLVSGAAGALSGALGVWRYADEIASIRVQGVPTGGRELLCGPSNNLNFPFVLLGRALLHQQLLCQRTHADRSHLALEGALLTALDDRERRRLGRIFAQLRAEKRVEENRSALTTLIESRCAAQDQR